MSPHAAVDAVMPTRFRRILEVLAVNEHGLYVLDIAAIAAVPRNGLYVVLGRMEDRGLIESREDGRCPPRRRYHITPAGSAALTTRS